MMNNLKILKGRTVSYTQLVVPFFIALFVLISCGLKNDHTVNIVIRKAGSYQSKQMNVKLQVTVENDLVRYVMSDMNDVKLFNSIHNFSDLHTWAIVLEPNKNLWILSSDIGNAVWRYDSVFKVYNYTVLPRRTTKANVSLNVTKDLEEFFN